jgi:hypothetical protein
MDPRPGLKLVQPITMRPETRPNLKPGGASIPSGLLIHLYGKKNKKINLYDNNK